MECEELTRLEGDRRAGEIAHVKRDCAAGLADHAIDPEAAVREEAARRALRLRAVAVERAAERERRGRRAEKVTEQSRGVAAEGLETMGEPRVHDPMVSPP